jgi:hypothetical protein
MNPTLPVQIELIDNIDNFFIGFKNKSRLGSVIFLFMLLLLFFGVVYYATLHIFVLIFGIVFIGILTSIIIAFKKNSLYFALPWSFIEIDRHSLIYGRTNKTKTKRKVLHKKNISDITKITFNYDIENRTIYNDGYELTIYSAVARKKLEQLTKDERSIDDFKKTVRKEGKTIQIFVSGVRVVDLMKLEKYIKQKLRTLGGHPIN